MKVNYMISTAAVLAALLTFSCTKDLQENAPVSGKDSDKVTLLIAADEVTKTTFGDKGDKYEVKWEEDTDKIGIFIASSSANVQASLKRIEGKAYFAAEVSNYNVGDQLCAYYPYAENAGKDVSKVTLKVPYLQTQTAPNIFNGSNNPMVAVPMSLPDAGTTVNNPLKFRHIGAVLEFDITGVPSNEKLKSVQFVSSDGGGFPATDNSIYDLTSVTEAGDLNTVAGTYYKSVTVSLKDGGFTPGQSAKVYMTIVPGTYNGNIYISTDKNLYRYEGQTIEANRAAVKPIKADLSRKSNPLLTTKLLQWRPTQEIIPLGLMVPAKSSLVQIFPHRPISPESRRTGQANSTGKSTRLNRVPALFLCSPSSVRTHQFPISYLRATRNRWQMPAVTAPLLLRR